MRGRAATDDRAWLALRRILEGWTRSIPAFVYTFIVFVPLHAGPLARCAPSSQRFACSRFRKARRYPPICSRAAADDSDDLRGRGARGRRSALCGGRLGGPHVRIPILRATHVDLAVVTRAVLLAEPLAFAVPVLLFATFALVVWLRGNDALPEIYAASNAALARRSRFRGPRNGRPHERSSAAVRSTGVPPGARAIVWKEWAALRRNSGALALWLAGAVVGIGCGAGAASVSLRFHDASTLATLGSRGRTLHRALGTVHCGDGPRRGAYEAALLAIDGSLRTRIAAWAFARSWRGGASAGCGVAAAALVLGDPVFALLALPMLGLASWSFSALGIGFFAVFPNPLDARASDGTAALFGELRVSRAGRARGYAGRAAALGTDRRRSDVRRSAGLARLARNRTRGATLYRIRRIARDDRARLAKGRTRWLTREIRGSVDVDVASLSGAVQQVDDG